MRDGLVYSEIMHGYLSCSGGAAEVRFGKRSGELRAVRFFCFRSPSKLRLLLLHIHLLPGEPSARGSRQEDQGVLRLSAVVNVGLVHVPCLGTRGARC